MTAKSDTFSVRLPDGLRKEVDNIARLTKRSRSYVINEAVAAYVRDKADYLAELDEAVRSAESGVGHSGEQIFAWLRSWGTEGEMAPPEPDLHPRSKI